MKKYFVVRGNFGNVYALYWADTPELEAMLPKSAERITRKEAEELARDELYRRKHEPYSSGYAHAAIYPAFAAVFGFFPDDEDEGYIKNGYIWERIK